MEVMHIIELLKYLEWKFEQDSNNALPINEKDLNQYANLLFQYKEHTGVQWQCK